MKLNERDKVKYLTFDLFENTKSVKHAFSTRCGGVSKDCFSEMNLGFNRGDNKENVLANYNLFCESLSINFEDMAFTAQVHGVRIKHVKKGDFCEATDAMITNKPNVVLTTIHADCVALYFFDKVEKVIALAHAGWRGTVAEIGTLTVEEMKRVYGCNSENIIVGIAPAISKCCFEVDFPVYNEFTKFDYWEKYIDLNNETGKYNIDLKGINKQMLINSGIREDNIEVTNLCTKCNPDLFYSHRLMGSERGTMIAVMELVEN